MMSDTQLGPQKVALMAFSTLKDLDLVDGNELANLHQVTVHNFMEGQWLWRAWAFKQCMDCGDDQLQTLKVDYDSYDKSVGIEFSGNNNTDEQE